tara:strand:- start:129 stop:680 length:552 start_codon:yes stop_codon:yes gene_type:complete
MKFLIPIIFFISFIIKAENDQHHHENDHNHEKEKTNNLEAHQHGVSKLNIVQENNKIIFEFEMPGYDIVGFEYKARKKEDIKKTRTSLDLLKISNNMLELSLEAECSNELTFSEVIYEGSHSEFISKYGFICKNIKKLNDIKINFFDTFSNSKYLEINIVTSKIAKALKVKKDKNRINVKDFF